MYALYWLGKKGIPSNITVPYSFSVGNSFSLLLILPVLAGTGVTACHQASTMSQEAGNKEDGNYSDFVLCK